MAGFFASTMRLICSRWTRPRTDGMTDAVLVARFVEHKDQAAYEALMGKHSPMVWRVCRQLLGDTSDAEDVFQATFLCLVENPGEVTGEQSLAPWLYTVAYRLALNVNRATRCRKKHVGEVKRMNTESTTDAKRNDKAPIVHQELHRLPEKYRTPLILRYVEDRTCSEIAEELGIPLGTVNSRLSRGREKLKNRLNRRGVTLAVVISTFSTVPALSAVPPALLQETIQAAINVLADGKIASPTVARLVKARSRAILLSNLWSSIKLACLVAVLYFLLTIPFRLFGQEGDCSLRQKLLQVRGADGSAGAVHRHVLTSIDGRTWHGIRLDYTDGKPVGVYARNITRVTMKAQILSVNERSGVMYVPELQHALQFNNLEGIFSGKSATETESCMVAGFDESDHLVWLLLLWPVTGEPP